MSIVLNGLKSWRLGVLICFGVAMLCTPADPLSMLLVAVPLCGIYSLGIATGMVLYRSRTTVPD